MNHQFPGFGFLCDLCGGAIGQRHSAAGLPRLSCANLLPDDCLSFLALKESAEIGTPLVQWFKTVWFWPCIFFKAGFGYRPRVRMSRLKPETAWARLVENPRLPAKARLMALPMSARICREPARGCLPRDPRENVAKSQQRFHAVA